MPRRLQLDLRNGTTSHVRHCADARVRNGEVSVMAHRM